MKRENLYCALSDISDTFISEANDVREGNIGAVAAVRKRRTITFVSGAMAAACACVCALTLAIVLPMQNNTSGGDLPSISSPGTSEPDGGNTSPGTSEPDGGSTGDSSGGQDFSGGGASQGSMPIYGVGSVRSGKHGSVRFASRTEYSATFEFDITSDVPYDSTILLTFYNYVEEGKTPVTCRLTTSDYDYGGERLSTDMLKLTVNGELSPQYKMPDKVGHYEVVFDYSAVLEEYDHIRVGAIAFTSLQEIWYSYQFIPVF